MYFYLMSNNDILFYYLFYIASILKHVVEYFSQKYAMNARISKLVDDRYY